MIMNTFSLHTHNTLDHICLIPSTYPISCTQFIQVPVSRRRGSESEGGSSSAEKHGHGLSKNKPKNKSTASAIKTNSTMQRKADGAGGMAVASSSSSSSTRTNDDSYSAVALRARLRRAGSLGTLNLHEVQVGFHLYVNLRSLCLYASQSFHRCACMHLNLFIYDTIPT